MPQLSCFTVHFKGVFNFILIVALVDFLKKRNTPLKCTVKKTAVAIIQLKKWPKLEIPHPHSAQQTHIQMSLLIVFFYETHTLHDKTIVP